MRLQFFGMSLMLLAAGCANYVTPGRAAPMAALGVSAFDQRVGTDSAIKDAMAKKPLASFPAAVAIVRVQSPEYRDAKRQTAAAMLPELLGPDAARRIAAAALVRAGIVRTESGANTLKESKYDEIKRPARRDIAIR